MWDIITHSVVDFVLTNSKVTSVKFAPDGEKIVAGFFDGTVVTYQCISRPNLRYELKYSTEFVCKDRRGRFSNGAKVTGLSFVETQNSTAETLIHHNEILSENARKKVADEKAMHKLLVTTNDSNIRLVDWNKKTTFCKFKGGRNEALQIQANYSKDNRFLISGTDDGYIMIWSLEDAEKMQSSSCLPSLLNNQGHHVRNNVSVSWNNHNSNSASSQKKIMPPVTEACFAPAASIPLVLNSVQENRNLSRSTCNQHQPDKPLYRFDDAVHFASLIVATADYEGNIRIYVRTPDE